MNTTAEQMQIRIKELEEVNTKLIADWIAAIKANAEVASLNADLSERIGIARERATQAQFQIRSAQINWQEECYFEADDLLTGTIAALNGEK